MSTPVSSLSTLSVQLITWERVCTMTVSDLDMLNLADLIENGIQDSQLKMPVSFNDLFQS